MRIALLIGEGFPNPTTGGGALTAWTLLAHLLREGHQVTVCAVYHPDYYDPTGASADERTERLRELGAEVRAIQSRSAEYFRNLPRTPRARLRRAWRAEDAELYPYLVDAETVRDVLEEVAPDVCLVYHFEALAASRLARAPRFAAVGDPSHLPLLYRWRAGWRGVSALRGLVRLQSVLRHQPRLMVELLRECAGSGAFAAHHAAWLRSRGVSGCAYLRTPVPDIPGAAWRSDRDRLAVPDRPRLLLLGHLRGIVTLEGLRLFAHGVLPRLERDLGADGFEVRIVGGYDLPADLRHLASRPSVRLIGHVERPGEELASASCLVVPTSIPLGVRVRIISAFSFGCPVVAHTANSLGIPELEHERNALLASTGRGLAQEIVRLAGEPELMRRLEENGRATYERLFSPPVAAGAISSRLDQLAAARPCSRFSGE